MVAALEASVGLGVASLLLTLISTWRQSKAIQNKEGLAERLLPKLTDDVLGTTMVPDEQFGPRHFVLMVLIYGLAITEAVSVIDKLSVEMGITA